jgi:hypothetical protein
MVISFVRVTPEELDLALDSWEWADEHIDGLSRDGEPSGYLDKAWSGLQYLLGQAGVSIEFQLTGELMDDEGTYMGWSPADVREAAEELTATAWERLAEHFKPATMDELNVYPGNWTEPSSYEYLKSYYENITAFFANAAAKGSGAIRCLG